MEKESIDLGLSPLLKLDPASQISLYQQIYEGVRNAILNGQMTPGQRLPPTRLLATDLAVSRNTVLNAFSQLMAEGYLAGMIGSGTYVANDLPAELLQFRRPVSNQTEKLHISSAIPETHRAGATWMNYMINELESMGPFSPGLPATDAFPRSIWTRLAQRHWRNLPNASLGYRDLLGYKPLREAIARYLIVVRGVHCDPDQVLIVNGSQQALDLTARTILKPGEEAWMEDPHYFWARQAFAGAGAKLVSVPVDSEGLKVEVGIRKSPGARLVYVTPSCQFPLGVTMSLTRRLKLLDWARRSGAWILEDDYQSELWYQGRLLKSLQGLDTHNRVIYTGTFSKALFPALRVGYLVLPADLIEKFVMTRLSSNLFNSILEQVVLTHFIEEGHLSRHLRRMRNLYGERQEALVQAMNKFLGGMVEVQPTSAGLHLIGWLPDSFDDNQVVERLSREDIISRPLSFYCSKHKLRPGLLLGFAAFDEKKIWSTVRRMTRLLRA